MIKEREFDVLMFEANRKIAEKEEDRKRFIAKKRKFWCRKVLSFLHINNIFE